MSKEFPGSPESERAAAQERMLDGDYATIRREVKDLQELLERSSDRVANRERVLRLVEEILRLVPVHSQELEDVDERDRAFARGEIEPFADEIASEKREDEGDA